MQALHIFNLSIENVIIKNKNELYNFVKQYSVERFLQVYNLTELLIFLHEWMVLSESFHINIIINVCIFARE